MTDPDYVRLLTSLRPSGWNVATIDPNTGRIQGAFIETVARLKEWVVENNGHLNCYFSPNYMPDVTAASKYRGSKGLVREPQWLYADVDPYKGGEGTLEERKAEALARVRAIDPHPFAIVDTGGGYQPLWHTASPMTMQTSDALNYGLLEDLAGDKGTYTADRLLRLPGTINIPNAKKVALGRVSVEAKLIELHPERTVEEFEFRYGEPPEKVDRQFGEPETPADFNQLTDQYSLTKSLTDLIITGDSERKIGDGSRSDRVFYVTSELLRHGVPDELILGTLLNPEWGISESLYEKGDDDAERAAERALKHAYDYGAAKTKAVEAFADDIPEEFMADAPAQAEKAEKTKPMNEHQRLVKRFKAVTILDLLGMEEPRWLVEEWITEGGMFGLFGGEKSYKTFLLIDLFSCIATGRDWHGIPCMSGDVRYIIGEGNARRFGDRLLAWCIQYKATPTQHASHFSIIPFRVGVDNDDERNAFFEANPTKCIATGVDTVARNMDGDESMTIDMNRFVKGLDKVREVTEGAAGVAHHTGKDPTKGARGSTALIGAVDAMIRVEWNKAKGEVVVELYRARDSEQGKVRIFKPVVVQVNDMDAVKPRFSIAMEFVREGTADDLAKDESKAKEVAPAAKDRVLVALAECKGAGTDSQTAFAKEVGVHKGTVSKSFAALKAEGLIAGSGPWFCTKAGLEEALRHGAVIDADNDGAIPVAETPDVA